MYEYKVNALRVIDGDTVEVTLELGFHICVTHKLRLLDINAPETRGKDRAAGIHASNHLRSLIQKHAPVIVRTHRDKQGKYGRYLATIVGRDGRSLNEEMVLSGHAVMY